MVPLRLEWLWRNLTSHWSVLHRSQIKTCLYSATLPDKQMMSEHTRSIRICCKTQDGVRSSPDWRRVRGRPPTTWIQQICRNTGKPLTNALKLTQSSRSATNRNGGILRLNASRHDDDHDDDIRSNGEWPKDQLLGFWWRFGPGPDPRFLNTDEDHMAYT